ncbi:MAG: 7-cyano-7-deazaguanine synthase QueC [Candidatus Margulisiibacteriota bacterium]
MKSIAILSGGIDSTVSMHIAAEKGEVILALTFDYGQKSAIREIEAAQNIAALYKVEHQVIELPWLKEITNTSLVHTDKEVPRPNREDLDSEKAHETAQAVWVPNRNGVFINIAAAYAESLDAGYVITGFNAEEAMTFPDNSMNFIESIKKSLSYSTLSKVKVVSYTQTVSKSGIIKLAREKNIPIWKCWSCYLGDDAPCGQCESCKRVERGLEESGFKEWYNQGLANGK